MTKFKYSVKIQWHNEGTSWWNETAIKVIEVFGLPGNRFMFRAEENHMSFEFKNEKDQQLCKILLSEKL